MNHTPPFDRDAIAKRIFDEVICSANSDLSDALNVWLGLIEGVSGYLRISADQAQFYGADPNQYGLPAMGEAIHKAAKIARVLAESMGAEARRGKA